MNINFIILQYELKLTASDNLKENYTTVVIHVKDVNDNPPVFERPTYITQITEEDDRNLPKRVLQVYKLWLDNNCSLRKNFLYKPVGNNVRIVRFRFQVTATDGDKDRPQNIVYFLTGQGIDRSNVIDDG